MPISKLKFNLLLIQFIVGRDSHQPISNMICRNNILRSCPKLISSKRLFSSSSLLREQITLTLYAKDGCSLCDKAKVVLDQVNQDSNVQKKYNLQYVDITQPLNKQWWDRYCFDVPVLHVDRTNQEEPVKMMHYLNQEEIVTEINK